MAHCSECDQLADKLISVQHFYDRELVFCSSRCFLTFGLKEYMKHSDGQLDQARKEIHDVKVAVETALSGDQRASILDRIRAVRSALFLIDRRK